MKPFTELKKYVMDLDNDVRDMYSVDQEVVEIMDKENLDEVTAISKFIQRARKAGRKLRAKSALFLKKRMKSLKRYKKPEAIKRIARKKAIDLLVQKIYKLPYRSLPMQRKAQITQNFLSKPNVKKKINKIAKKQERKVRIADRERIAKMRAKK